MPMPVIYAESFRSVVLYTAPLHLADPINVMNSFTRGDDIEYSCAYFSSVMGKLCFGYEQMNQVGLAEEAGNTALSHTPKDIWTIHSMAHVKDSKHE